tara:strand:- start:1544 stop:2104 length:561 start_codon:yes stop_codon:yes gene_type:complete
MIYSQTGDLLHHIYCFVDMEVTRKDKRGFEPCVMFAINSTHGRLWGCNVLLECGAIYRNVPVHKIAFYEELPAPWTEQQAQIWDCYGPTFSILEFTYLHGVEIETRAGDIGEYLFTVVPIGDGFSRAPDQAKEFTWIKLNNGRLAVLPTDHILVHEVSFTKTEWPTDIRKQVETYSTETINPERTD